jgi:hypothetical protein
VTFVDLELGQSIVLPHGAILTVCKLKPDRASLGIAAPPEVSIVRPDAKAGPKPGVTQRPPREFAVDSFRRRRRGR